MSRKTLSGCLKEPWLKMFRIILFENFTKNKDVRAQKKITKRNLVECEVNFLSPIIQETRRLCHVIRMWRIKGTMTHEESDVHKEMVDHGEMEDCLNEI